MIEQNTSRRKLTKLNVLGIAVLLALLFILIVSSQLKSYSTSNPEHPQYSFKRLVEKIRLSMASDSQKKLDINISLLDERFKEMQYLAENRKLGQFQKSSERFNTAAGELIESAPDLSAPAKERLHQQATTYVKEFPRLRDLYEANSAYWLLLQQNLDTSNRLLSL
jgi:hypothetical protein